MALPPQVQAQLDQAEALLKPIEAPAPAADPVVQEPSAEVTPQEGVTPQPTANEENVATKPQSAPVKEDWEQKFKTLTGIHRSFERRVAEAEAIAKQANEDRQRLLSLLEQAKAEKPAAAEETTFDPKDAEVFGADLVDMVQRVAKAAFATSASDVIKRLDAVEQRLSATASATSKTAEEVFYDRLRSLVPDYEAVNADEGFLAWLAEEDPVYGMPRQAALTRAANDLDVGRVAKVFTTYKNSVSQPAPAPSARLETQLAPPTAASAAPRQPTQKSFITTAEVQSFYRDVQSGRYVGREKEALAREAAINAALAEGRIVDRVPRHAHV